MKTLLLILVITLIAINLSGEFYWEMSNEELLTLAAENDSLAMQVLGQNALAEEDYPTAVEWFTKAAELGECWSCFELGMMHLKAELENPSLEDAITYFENAGKLGCPDAYLELAKLYHQGKKIQQDISKAVEYYKLCGNDLSIIRLSELYQDNLVEGQSPEDTFYWTKEASQHIPESNCLWVADAYAHGYGTEKNMQEALDWYGRAASYQKVPEALELAILCHEGDEVTQDLELAYFWALMAQKTEERDNPKLKELMTSLEASLDEDTRGSILENVQEMQKRWFD
ncbi:MAG: tetratricopeptide repeat protein [Candidatus Cloacimonetes bacterium]|nr:tetratricopeptide repeat protein [Candidatus Cloacimonadota bacterium]MDD3097751.1 tetratricopeptide repeat protein [Candidatus Cloacimonadota bacterium]MDD3578271.1 tetratricopeptide repeat protein [Candidatus Cloacimonadota bacterium]